jgi:hypothetical protein
MYSSLLPQILELLNTIAGLLTPVFWYWLNLLEFLVFI